MARGAVTRWLGGLRWARRVGACAASGFAGAGLAFGLFDEARDGQVEGLGEQAELGPGRAVGAAFGVGQPGGGAVGAAGERLDAQAALTAQTSEGPAEVGVCGHLARNGGGG